MGMGGDQCELVVGDVPGPILSDVSGLIFSDVLGLLIGEWPQSPLLQVEQGLAVREHALVCCACACLLCGAHIVCQPSGQAPPHAVWCAFTWVAVPVSCGARACTHTHTHTGCVSAGQAPRCRCVARALREGASYVCATEGVWKPCLRRLCQHCRHTWKLGGPAHDPAAGRQLGVPTRQHLCFCSSCL